MGNLRTTRRRRASGNKQEARASGSNSLAKHLSFTVVLVLELDSETSFVSVRTGEWKDR